MQEVEKEFLWPEDLAYKGEFPNWFENGRQDARAFLDDLQKGELIIPTTSADLPKARRPKKQKREDEPYYDIKSIKMSDLDI